MQSTRLGLVGMPALRAPATQIGHILLFGQKAARRCEHFPAAPLEDL